MAELEYRFYRDGSDGSLIRSADRVLSDVWISPFGGHEGFWSFFPVQWFADPLQSITREEAQLLNPSCTDLDAPNPSPPNKNLRVPRG